jgi:hypothetical protein
MVSVSFHYWPIPTETHVGFALQLAACLLKLRVGPFHDKSEILDWRLPGIGSCKDEIHIED